MKVLIFLSILLFFYACNMDQNLEKGKFDNSINSEEFVISDTIIYDVIVKNPNIDDQWAEKCLGNFKRDEFMNMLFDKIYKSEIIAYDIYSGSVLNIEEVKQIEKNHDYNRKNIGKFQFEEKWFFNQQEFSLNKKVSAIHFGYEVYNNEGEIRGYKPLFKILFN